MLFQSIQEQEQRVFEQPKGRKLLWVIFERFKMEKDRGIALTQTHLLGLKMSGTDIKALEDSVSDSTSCTRPWRDRVTKLLGAPFSSN